VSHSSKVCTCGARFQLQVELAVHCHATGHAPYQALVAAGPAPALSAAVAVGTRNVKMTVVSALALVSLLGLTCGLNATVRSYTSWKYSSNVLMLP
jgi:hypothetical protein